MDPRFLLANLPPSSSVLYRLWCVVSIYWTETDLLDPTHHFLLRIAKSLSVFLMLRIVICFIVFLRACQNGLLSKSMGPKRIYGTQTNWYDKSTRTPTHGYWQIYPRVVGFFIVWSMWLPPITDSSTEPENDAFSCFGPSRNLLEKNLHCAEIEGCEHAVPKSL
jgi:hypothetical protein